MITSPHIGKRVGKRVRGTGAVVGIYSGGVIANHGEYNPSKWNFSSDKTWAYMLCGGVVGGISGAAGGLVTNSSIPFANTVSMATSSIINSFGTHLFTHGKTPFSVSLGAISYDFTNHDIGFLGEKGNGRIESLGFILGALGNLSDVFRGFKPQKVDLVTEHSDF